MRRPQKALTEAQELGRANPNSPEVMALVGEVAAEAGNSELAISELKRAVGRIATTERLGSTDCVHVRKLLAGLLLEGQRATEALTLLNELTQKVPADDTEVQLLLGAALLRSGKAADAVATLRRYLLGRPNSPRAQALLAQALAESGQVQQGIELLERSGDHPEVLVNRRIRRRRWRFLPACRPRSRRACVSASTTRACCSRPSK
jgi:predicted Zn-dependent protease